MAERREHKSPTFKAEWWPLERNFRKATGAHAPSQRPVAELAKKPVLVELSEGVLGNAVIGALERLNSPMIGIVVIGARIAANRSRERMRRLPVHRLDLLAMPSAHGVAALLEDVSNLRSLALLEKTDDPDRAGDAITRMASLRSLSISGSSGLASNLDFVQRVVERTKLAEVGISSASVSNAILHELSVRSQITAISLVGLRGLDHGWLERLAQSPGLRKLVIGDVNGIDCEDLARFRVTRPDVRIEDRGAIA